MHIVFLTHVFPSISVLTGGAASYVANMAQIMVSNGNKVDVIVEANDKEIIEWNGITIHKIRATRGFKNNGRAMPTYKKFMKNIWRSYWYNKEVNKINKQHKVDIVQSVDTYGLALFRRKNIPYVIRMSGYPALWSGAAREVFDFDKCVLSKRIDEEIQLMALKKVNAVVSPSYLIQKIINNKMGISPYVVESPVMLDDSEDYKLNENDIEEGKYFLTYGDLGLRKSIHVLALIIDKLLSEYTDMKYVIVGKNREFYYEGQYIYASELLYSKIIKNRDRFILLEEISDKKRLFSIVKNAAICVLPTRVDNLPNTCLESMALGKIIVSTTSKEGTSVEQLITDGENGFLAEVDDPESLLNKIKYAMDLPADEKEKIQAKAKERIKDLTPKQLYKKMLQIYRETIRNFEKKTLKQA